MALKNFLNTQDWSCSELNALLTQARVQAQQTGERPEGQVHRLSIFQPIHAYPQQL